jgi:hypothetical protein
MLEAAREIAGLDVGVWWFALLTVPAGLWLGLWFAHQHRTLTPWWKCVLMPLIVSGSGAAVVFASALVRALFQHAEGPPLASALKRRCPLVASLFLTALWLLVAR